MKIFVDSRLSTEQLIMTRVVPGHTHMTGEYPVSHINEFCELVPAGESAEAFDYAWHTEVCCTLMR